MSTTYERALAYLDKLPPAVSGSGGHNQTLRAACELFRFGLTQAEAWDALQNFNARCQPPWKDYELRHKLTDAEKIVRASSQYAARAGRRFPARVSRSFTAPRPPARPRRVLPVRQRTEPEEEAWWAVVFAARGIVDPAAAEPALSQQEA